MTGLKLASFGLPSPIYNVPIEAREVLRETSYDVNMLAAQVNTNMPKLTPDQSQAFNTIISMIAEKQGGVAFLDAPGGTGKTFLLNLLLAAVRKEKLIAIAVASSGIAATLLDNGRTAHSTFKLPLNLATSEDVTCNISKGTGMARLLQECKLIVWDEATMSHKNAFYALDKTLRDIRSCNKTMGGVTVVLSGDFRQTLPIIPRGTPADEIKACLKNSYLWPEIIKLSLTTNMRARHDPLAEQLSERLLKIGEGEVDRDEDGRIVPPCGHIVTTIDELKRHVFPDIEHNYQKDDWLCERAILAAKNDTVDQINTEAQNCITGFEKTYKAVDVVTKEDQAVEYPLEFLNSIEIPGLQPYKLTLKVGSPIVLIRNLNAPRLCNGTRLIVKQLKRHVIQATVSTGCAKGEDVFIPKIPINSPGDTFPFKRIQFPIKLCFAMTINKAQGQSLGVVGVDLRTECFSHGQLYVACSRVGQENNLYILAPDGKTKNVVYPQALQ